MGPLIATLFTIVAVAISSFAIVNPNTSLENRVAAACVSEGGIYANGTGNCCSGLIKTNCGGSGSFAYCYCKKPAATPAPTPSTKSCTKRTCSGTTCNSQTVTVSYSQACPSSNCTSNTDCAPAPTTTTTPIPTPICKKLNESFSSIVPCCSNLVKIVSPYGTVCGNQGDCVPGATKCQNDGLKSFVYVCDSSGYYQVNKTCDFGCNGNACKTAVCTSGAKRCNPDNSDELQTCSSDGSSWKGQSCTNGCVNSACKILTCDGKPQGTQECNATGGYNYCKEGSWYNHDCESGTTCISGKCQIIGAKAKGEKCDSNLECATNNCNNTYINISGEPTYTYDSVCVPSLAEQDSSVTRHNIEKGVLIGGAAALTAAPIAIPEIIDLAVVGGGILSLPTATYVYATNTLSSLPAWTGPALEIVGTFPAVYETAKCQFGECTSEEQAQAQEISFFTGVGVQQLFEAQIGSNKSSFELNNVSDDLKTFEKTFDTSVVSRQNKQAPLTPVTSTLTDGKTNDKIVINAIKSNSKLIGEGSFGSVYENTESNSVIKFFFSPELPDNLNQLTLYKEYGNKAPLLTFKGEVPGGFIQEKITDAKTLGDYVKQSGTFTIDEVNQAVDNLIQTQIITGQAHGDLARPPSEGRWKNFGYLHPGNILIQPNPSGGVSIIPIDYGGYSGVSAKMGLTNSSPEFLEWEADIFRSGLNKFVTNITK